MLTKNFVGKRSSRTDASGSRKASVSLCVVVWRLGPNSDHLQYRRVYPNLFANYRSLPRLELNSSDC